VTDNGIVKTKIESIANRVLNENGMDYTAVAKIGIEKYPTRVYESFTLPAGSYGWSGAYGTHFWVDPSNQVIAIYMKNSRWYDSHGCGTIGAQFEKDVMACLE
jgi:CubicO group peptidase (beta-lactamase class C family)